MAEIADGSFTHTLEQIDDAVTEVSSTIGESASLTAAIESIAGDAASTAAATAAASAIADLDVTSAGGTGKYISSIKQEDGKINATPITMDSTPTDGSKKAITSEAVYTALQTRATVAQLLGAGTGLSSGTDLNAVKTIGRYYWGSTVAAALANSPVSTYTLLSSEPDDWVSAYGSKYFEKYTEANTGKERYRFVQGETAPAFAANTYYKCSGAGGTLTVENIQAGSRVRQTFVENDTLAKSGRYFVRFFASSYNGTWSSWFKFEGAEVTQ